MKQNLFIIILCCLNINWLGAAEHTSVSEPEKRAYDPLKTKLLLQEIAKKTYIKNNPVILRLVEEGADPHVTTPGVTDVFESVLLRACFNDDLPMVQCALQHRANPNGVAYRKYTPLMSCKSLEVARCLVDHNANVHELSKGRNNVLHCAEDYSVSLLVFFCDQNVDPNILNNEFPGSTPLDNLIAAAPLLTPSEFAQKTAILLLAGARLGMKDYGFKLLLGRLDQRLVLSIQTIFTVAPAVKLERDLAFKAKLASLLVVNMLPVVAALTIEYAGSPPVWDEMCVSLFKKHGVNLNEPIEKLSCSLL